MKLFASLWFLSASLLIAQSPQPSGTPGMLKRSLWKNIPGYSLEALSQEHDFYDTPFRVDIQNNYSVPPGTSGDYAQKYQGYLIAPVTGEYRFWLTSDWISPDVNKFNKQFIVDLQNWTFKDDYGRYREQAGEPVSLVAGQRYYVEAQHKDDTGGQHFKVAWSYAGGAGLTNWCLDSNAIASQSSTDGVRDASRAIDGNASGTVDDNSVSVTKSEAWAKWQVDLGAMRQIDRIELFNRDNDGRDRTAQLKNYVVQVLDGSENVVVSKNFRQSSTFTEATEFWETGGVVGQVVKVVQLGGNVRYLNLAEVRVLGRPDATEDYQPQALFSGSMLESYAGHLNDQDDDGLPDDWEVANGFDPTVLESGNLSPAGDPDRDGLHTALEAELGADPFTKDVVLRYLTVETWNDHLAFDVKDFVESDRFYQEPDIRKTIFGSKLFNIAASSGNRVRGYITAATTGTHHFWLSASDGAELWISTDNTKYRKRRVAVLGAEAGTGHGILPGEGDRFDRFSSQMSEGIELVAGQTYFFEAINQRKYSWAANMAIAWAQPGADRTLLPASVISSYGHETEDDDNDYLPDAWETLYGLDPLDNGLSDRARQGEKGDFDMDGLSNREEFVAGTNPADADSDGDEINDADELRSYGTDPTQSDAPSEILLSSLDLSTFQGNSSQWTMTSDGLVPQLFRGSVSWNFSVPAQGFWNINISTRLIGDLYLHEVVPVEVLIDGTPTGTQELIFGAQREAMLRVITPELSAGSHLLTLNIDNILARRSVAVMNIDVLEPSGADLDSDGTPDWITSHLVGRNSLATYQSTSRTSPAFLEGRARLGATVNGSSTRVGTDAEHWYTDLPLNEVGSTPFTASFEGGLSDSGSITWTTSNVLDNETLVVRQYDSLKLTAVPTGGPTNQSATFTLPGQTNHALDPSAVATQSSTPHPLSPASKAIDGDTAGGSHDNGTRTQDEEGTWWQVDLGQERSVDRIVIWPKFPREYSLVNFRVQVIDNGGAVLTFKDFYTSGQWNDWIVGKEVWHLGAFYDARTVRIQKLGESFSTNRIDLAEVQVFGTSNYHLADDANSFTYQMTQPGTQVVSVAHANGQAGALTVEVKKATFDGTPQDLLNNGVGALAFVSADVDSSLYFDGGAAVSIDQQPTEIGSYFYLQATSRVRGSANVLARLYDGGSVLGAQPVNFLTLSGALQNDLTIGMPSQNLPGYVIQTTPIVATGLEPGATVVVRIFRAGVTFLDGTKTKTLSSADFTNGVAVLEFLFPQGLEGGYCHHLDIYDRNGAYLGRR